jgi:hypothetical protein
VLYFQQMRTLRTLKPKFFYARRIEKFCFEQRKVRNSRAGRLLAPTQKRGKHEVLTLLVSFGASACSTSTVTRTRSVARDLSRVASQEASKRPSAMKTRKTIYLSRVCNYKILRDLQEAIA